MFLPGRYRMAKKSFVIFLKEEEILLLSTLTLCIFHKISLPLNKCELYTQPQRNMYFLN